MKKVVLLIFTMVLLAGVSDAKTCPYTCVYPHDLSFGFSRFMSTVTGSNFLGKQVAKAILKKEISKNADGKFTVKVDSYSVKDLKKGIFKTVSIKGKNISSNGVYVSRFEIQTLCKFNYISLSDNQEPIFKEDLPLAFELVVSDDDLNKTMASDSYKNILNKLNKVGANYGLFKINDTGVKIKDGKFYYILNVVIPFVKNPQNVVVVSDLVIVDGEIDFTNTRLINSRFSLDLKKIDGIINYLNPLHFSLNILENKDARVTVQHVKIEDNKIVTSGFFIVPKDED